MFTKDGRHTSTSQIPSIIDIIRRWNYLRCMGQELKASSRAILQAIAEGHSYEQILASGLAKSYLEIFQSAAEAVGTDSVQKRKLPMAEKVALIRQTHPRAYEPWTDEEEQLLTQLFKSGKSASEIGHELNRKTGAIRARLIKLKLITPGVYIPGEDDSPAAG